MVDGHLAPWLSSPATAGVLSDFDGTLSPIVEDPESARPLPGAPECLAALACRYRTVAVVSGRPVEFLVTRLGPLPRVVLVGLYGLEKGERGVINVDPEVRRWRETVAQVAAEAIQGAPAGVYVERKGLSVALHARRALEHAAWIEEWGAQQAARTGLRLQRGKMTAELLPPVDADKGRAVLDLAGGLSAVCYLGDDVGDLAAFGALRRLAGEGVATLAVAVRSPEVPAALLDQADVIVDGPEGALAWLDHLLPAIPPPGAGQLDAVP